MDLTALEKDINTVLHNAHARLVGDRARMAEFAQIYTAEVARGFYEGTHEAEGECPGDRRPNEAFMQASEVIWAPVDTYLQTHGLASQHTLRELFTTSREYDGDEHDLRIFLGHLISTATQQIVALFVLYIPHDNPHHTEFCLPQTFRLRLLPIN